MNPSERQTMIDYRLERVRKTMVEARDMASLEHWNTTVNRLYYACFYVVGALLLKHKIAAKSHDGLRRMFGLHFVKSGKVDKQLAEVFSHLIHKRQKGDYADLVKFDEASVVSLFVPTEQFINAIEKLVLQK
jgi:uncharacterized protein (UPF0332 family)